MRRSGYSILYFLAVVAIFAWGVVFYQLYQALQAPLGPKLVYADPTLNEPVMTDTPIVTQGPTSTTIPGQPTLTPYQASNENVPRCGGPTVMTMLAIGSDSRETGYLYGLSDVIRLVRVDFVTPKVSVLDFPRDLWVQIPDISSHYGITHGKLNQAYFYGNRGMGYYTGSGEGPGLLAQTLDLNFGAHADAYVAGDMQTFVRLIDTLGGIDVDLPYTVDGRKPDQPNRWDLYFSAGPHHLDGQQALMLARIRQYSVFQRTDHQNVVLCALRDSLLKPANLAKLPQIIGAFEGSVQTDLSISQIGQLACLLPQVEKKNISFASFPTNLLKGTSIYDKDMGQSVFIWDADFNILKVYVQAFYSGIWPASVGNIPLLPTETPAAVDIGATINCSK